MRILFLSLVLLISFPAIASRTLVSKIHDIDVGLPGEKVLVFLSTGDVVSTSQANLTLLENLQSGKSTNKWFEFTITKSREIKRIVPVTKPTYVFDENAKALQDIDLDTYIPTTVKDFATAKRYMAESRRTVKEETQCFNRAMVWVYEWWRKHSLRSNKVFIFWSKDYVRSVGFKWWFHVSPYIHVVDPDGNIVERTLDVKYTSRPYEFQDWADYHSWKDTKCMVITKYSEYADYPYGNGCYFYRANMFTYQPADLEMNEAWGYTKNAFNMQEVKGAYLEAFDIQL